MYLINDLFGNLGINQHHHFDLVWLPCFIIIKE